jgi:hypothetical protein
MRPDKLSICIVTKPNDCEDVGDGDVRILRCSVRELLRDSELLCGRRCIGEVDSMGGAKRERVAPEPRLLLGCGMVIALVR